LFISDARTAALLSTYSLIRNLVAYLCGKGMVKSEVEYPVQSALLLFRTHTVPQHVFAVARFLSSATVLTKLADFDF
jgi:hypothetical protein